MWASGTASLSFYIREKKWAKGQRGKTEIRKLKMNDHKKLDSMGNISFNY